MDNMFYSWDVIVSKMAVVCILQNLFILVLYNFVNKIPGGRLNKKDGLTRYGDSHVKDKTS